MDVGEGREGSSVEIKDDEKLDEECESGDLLASASQLKMSRQKTVDPSKMGNMQCKNSDGKLLEGLALQPQKSAKLALGATQPDNVKSNSRKKHNRRTAKEINR